MHEVHAGNDRLDRIQFAGAFMASNPKPNPPKPNPPKPKNWPSKVEGHESGKKRDNNTPPTKEE
jgi:hypothetical protein